MQKYCKCFSLLCAVRVQSLSTLSPCLCQRLMSHEINVIPFFLTSYYFVLFFRCNPKESFVIYAMFMKGGKCLFEIHTAVILLL